MKHTSAGKCKTSTLLLMAPFLYVDDISLMINSRDSNSKQSMYKSPGGHHE